MKQNVNDRQVKKMNKNLMRIITMSVLLSLDFFSAVEVAFFFQRMLDASDIYFIYAVFSVLIFVLEVPAGYLGDKIGHKNSILLGLLCGVAGFTGFIVSSGFWGIIISYMMMAMMTSLISGSDDAILYECLEKEKRQGDFGSVYAKVASLGYIGSIAGSILSGFIARFSLKANIVIQIILLFVVIIILFGIRVEKKHGGERENERGSLANTIMQSKSLIIILILAGFFMASTLIGTKFSQQIMLDADIPLAFFGVFAALNTLIASLFSYVASKVKKIPLYFTLIAPSLVLVLIGIGKNGFLVFLLFVSSASRAIGNVKITTLINQRISSNYRATINSMKSLLFRLFYSGIILMCGKFADINIYLAVMCSGIILLISISMCYIVRKVYVKNDISETYIQQNL
ncbi:MAG: MFS transporter [Clostridiales bacterium]|nr:MFS transporter [Clostridiales bacterium]